VSETATDPCRFCGRPVSGREGAYCSVGCRNADGVLDAPPEQPAWEPTPDDGHEREHERAFLYVAGMHCASCETFLERVAADQPGVVDASASYVTETIRVEYDPRRTDTDALVDALSVAGYRVADRAETGERTATTVLSRETGSETRDLEDLLGYRYVAGVLFGLFVMLPYVVVFYPLQLSELIGGPLEAFEGGPIESGLILLLPLFAGTTGVVVFFTGLPLLRGAYVSLRTRQPNTDLLAALTLVGAYVYSIAALLLGRLDMYFDLTILVGATVVAATFYESVVKQRAMERLTDLTISGSEDAELCLPGGTETLPVDELRPDDRVLVGQGERVPVDGTLAEGACTVDESVVTGESLPISKEAGDALVGGSTVIDGAAVVRVGDPPVSSVDRLATAVWLLQSATHGLQRSSDRLAARIVPAVVAVALLVGGAVAVTSGPADGGLAALVVVVLASPWVLALSTPLSVATSIQAAMARGVVVFDETVFERVRETDVVVFDKTGTLTSGQLSVRSADAPADVLTAVAALERRAAHPAAEAIAEAFGADGSASRPGDRRSDGLTTETGKSDGRATDGGTKDGQTADERPSSDRAVDEPLAEARDQGTVTDFETYGLGVGGTVDGSEHLVGHPDLFVEQGWSLPEALRREVDAERGFGRLPVVVGRDGEAVGVVVLADEPRADWAEVIAQFGERDVDVVVLTGDDEVAAEYVRDHPDVTHVFAAVPPAGKTAVINRLQTDRRVTMVGDGTNDAPALAAADLGIALGGGTALASDAADVAIAEDDLWAVETTFELATAAGRRVRENAALALSYNALVLPAALVGVVNPLVAMAAAVTSCALVASNAHRPLLRK